MSGKNRSSTLLHKALRRGIDAHLMTAEVKYSSKEYSPANTLTDRRSDSNLTDTPDGVIYYAAIL